MQESGADKDAFPQQVERSAPVHLTLEHLEPARLSFRLAIAPRGGQRLLDRSPVAAQAGGEAGKFGDAGGRGHADPRREGAAVLLPPWENAR